MEPGAPNKARIATLSREMDAIHTANELHWRRGDAATSEERAEYHKGLERLEQIRLELAHLRNV